MQSAASDLSLLEAAAHEAGALARDLAAQTMDIKSKGDAGPVTNIDYAVDALLSVRLQSARPDYGWLSEETPDVPANRLGKARVFMLDPIDGTAALIAKIPQWTISIGIVENGRAFAGVVYNPMTDEMFTGALGVGATLGTRAVRASLRDTLDGARLVGPRGLINDKRFTKRWPKLEIEPRQSIAYRLAAVAAGQADATVLVGAKHEWDVAAGAALVEAAGGCVSDSWGAPLVFNTEAAFVPGVVASGAQLHPLLIERTSTLPNPRAAREAGHT